MNTNEAMRRLSELKTFLNTGSTFDAADGAICLARELLRTLHGFESGKTVYVKYTSGDLRKGVLMYHPDVFTAEPIPCPEPVHRVFRDPQPDALSFVDLYRETLATDKEIP